MSSRASKDRLGQANKYADRRLKNILGGGKRLPAKQAPKVHKVSKRQQNGDVWFFEGQVGAERLVRIETTEGDVWFYEGPRGAERVLRITVANREIPAPHFEPMLAERGSSSYPMPYPYAPYENPDLPLDNEPSPFPMPLDNEGPPVANVAREA